MAEAQLINTSLKEWGTSRGVRIPKPMCEYCFIDIGSELTMQSGADEQGRFILIRPAAQSRTSYGDTPCIPMDAAFAGYTGDYTPTEADWGDDVGFEVVA